MVFPREINRVCFSGGSAFGKPDLSCKPGCYKFKFYDSGGDGLSFWANAAQGTGYARFVKMNWVTQIVYFNPDFGKEIEFHS